AAIKLELVRVAKIGVTREELKRAKDNVRGRLILKFEKPSSYLGFLMSQELITNRIEDLQTHLAKLQRVTLDDVNRVAHSVIRWKKANLALIGPYTNKKKFMDILLG